MLPSVTSPTIVKQEIVNVDDVDKTLISILGKDGRTSLVNMGKHVGMSHVAVGKRLEKLISNDIVRIIAQVNPQKLAMKMMVMGLETENVEAAEEIADRYRDCPRLLSLTPVTGSYNLLAVMVSENLDDIESVAGTCSMRTEKGVRRSETWIGSVPLIPEFLPINLAPEKRKGTATPCGSDCGRCARYEIERCTGCPSTDLYRGSIYKSPEMVNRKRKG